MQVIRRDLLTGAGAAIAGAATPAVPTFAAWEPSLRYPDPAVKILDPSFAKYRLGNAGVERLATGMRFGEGPVWFGDGRYLLMSDIPNDSIMRWDEETRRFSVFRRPSNKSNGLTRDRQGRLIVCEHGARRLTRTEYDGSITVLMDRFEGKQLNSPNDCQWCWRHTHQSPCALALKSVSIGESAVTISFCGLVQGAILN